MLAPSPGLEPGLTYPETFPAILPPRRGILLSKGGRKMDMKGLAISMGIGAAAGAVAIMMMPRNNTARKLASKAATQVEQAASKLGTALENKLESTLN